MSEIERELTIRRILVALDASPHSLAALEAAAQLAATLDAELIGLFVEDINLLRLAELPFAQEVGLFSATRRPLDTRAVQWELRAQADRARQALARIAGEARVRWTFRVARGAVPSEVLTAAAQADLISLGKLGWSPGRSKRLGSTAQAVLASAPGLTLIIQRGARLERSVWAVYDGSAAGERALAVAARLAGTEGALTVLLPADHPEEAQRLRHRAEALLRARGITAEYRWVRLTDLPRMIPLGGRGVLVVPGKAGLLPQDRLQQLLHEAECPVLLVR